MEAGACSCGYDYEPADNWWEETRRCAKDRRCDECGGTIKKGERYHVHTWVAEGQFGRVGNCQACERIREDFGCGVIGDLDEVIRETLGLAIREIPDDDE